MRNTHLLLCCFISLFLLIEAQSGYCNVKDYGAKGDGTTLDTEAIQRTIDSCNMNWRILFPKGKYLSGIFMFLKSAALTTQDR